MKEEIEVIEDPDQSAEISIRKHRKIRYQMMPYIYSHSIENLGDEEMIVLFWANQIFDPERTDTYYCKV